MTERRVAATLVLLALGYTGFYLCRVTFSVARPQLLAELVAGGLSADDARRALGAIASWSLLASAIGKFGAGILADRGGGRGSFLTGMLGVLGSTVLFTLGGYPVWLGAWCLHRLFQTLGWPSILRLIARRVAIDRRGAAIGWVSLSWLAGDAGARAFHGELFALGAPWRQTFWIAAGVLAAIFVATWFLLRDDPPEPSHSDEPAPRPAVRALIGPLLARPAFWCAVALSVSLSLLREALAEWAPTYLAEFARLPDSAAAAGSALFPLLGSVSAVAVGRLGDSLSARGRALLLAASTAAGGAGLWALATLGPGDGLRGQLLLALLGLTLVGPYAYLLGPIALELGGPRAGATASSVLDAFGSLAAILAGRGIAEAVAQLGWPGTFRLLAILGVAGAVAALVYGMLTSRSAHNGSVGV